MGFFTSYQTFFFVIPSTTPIRLIWSQVIWTTKQKLLRDVNRFVFAFARAVIQYGYTLEPRFTDTRLTQTACFYGQFSLSLALTFPLNSTRLIRTLFMAPLSVRITLFDSINLGTDHLQPCVLNSPSCMHRSSRLKGYTRRFHWIIICVLLFPDWNFQIFSRFKLGASIG